MTLRCFFDGEGEGDGEGELEGKAGRVKLSI